MALVYEWGFFLKPGVEDEFREWLVDHEPMLAEAAPENLEYLGTYLPVWAPEQRCDRYQLWRWRRADEFDLRTVAGSDQGRFADLARQFLSFVDDTRAGDESFRSIAPWSTLPPAPSPERSTVPPGALPCFRRGGTLQ